MFCKTANNFQQFLDSCEIFANFKNENILAFIIITNNRYATSQYLETADVFSNMININIRMDCWGDPGFESGIFLCATLKEGQERGEYFQLFP